MKDINNDPILLIRIQYHTEVKSTDSEVNINVILRHATYYWYNLEKVT